jgi:hypothetical protein
MEGMGTKCSRRPRMSMILDSIWPMSLQNIWLLTLRTSRTWRGVLLKNKAVFIDAGQSKLYI